MDPNQWNPYGRLPTGASVPTVAGLQPLLEQSGLGAAGLTALSPPLPAHAVAAAPRVAALNPYGHTLPGAVSQILDTMSLSQSLAVQAQYKAPSVPQFSIEQTVRTSPVEQVSTRNVAASTAPSLAHPSAQSPTVAVTDSQRWNLSSYMQPVTNSSFAEHSSGAGIQEPPPAHSGARPSTIQKHPYLAKTDYDPTSGLLAARVAAGRDPQPAHSHSSLPSRAIHEDLGLTRALVMQQQQQQPQQQQQQQQRYQEQSNHYKEVSVGNTVNSRSSYSETSPSNSHHSSYTGSPQVGTVASVLTPQQSFANSPQMHQTPAVTSYPTYSTNNTPSKTYASGQQSQASRGSSDCMKYEAVSPAAEPKTDSYTRTMALQDLADISSNQEKMPLGSGGSHQQRLLAALQQQQQSPVQTVPSPQQVSTMSLGSPQGHVASSPTVQTSQMPVQAVADSTTKRGRKSGGGKRGGSGGSGSGSRRRKSSTPVQHPQAHQIVSEPTPQLTHIQVPQPIVSHVPISSLSSYPAMVHNPAALVTMASTNGYDTISSQDLVSTITSASLAANNPEAYENPMMTQEALMAENQLMAMKDDCSGDDRPVFMTNTLGNAFVNPNDVLQQITPSPSEEDPSSQSSIEMDYYNRMKRNKAMIKQMPVPKEEVDEEFAHLVGEPVANTNAKHTNTDRTLQGNPMGQQHNPSGNPHNPGYHNPGNPHNHNPGNPHELGNPHNPTGGNPHNPGNPQQQPSTSSSEGKGCTGFQGSFLSFLQGKKPETLSSVTNTALIKKPELPKYVPDPRPRRVEQRPEPKKVMLDSSDDEATFVSSQEKRPLPVKKSPIASSTVVTFSDDDDDSSSQGAGSSTNPKSITKTVQSVITNLTVDEMPSTGRGRGRSRGRGHHPTARRGRGRGRGASLTRTPQMLPFREGNVEEIEISESDDDDDDDIFIGEDPIPRAHVTPSRGRGRGRGRGSSSKSKRERSPSPVVPRERSSRKAKDKVEKKRMEKLKRKSKRHKKSLGDSDYDVESKGSDEFMDLSSSSEHEAVYDSDKDPGWNPFGDTAGEKKLSSGSEDERPPGARRMSGGRGHRGKKSPLSPTGRPMVGRGRGSKPISMVLGPDDEDVPTKSLGTGAGLPVAPQPQSAAATTASGAGTSSSSSGPSVWDIPDDMDEAHNYPKGSFVIDRRDLTKHESFPIWRIDAGRLLQKYDPIVQDGEIKHKALSTYSSWSDNIRKSHKAIAVCSVSGSRSQDMVVVLEKHKPKPPDDKLEEDELMPSFTVYIQTMVSQALEPTFLAAIHKENEDYYTGPIKAVDEMLAQRQRLIEENVTWLEKFKVSLKTFPSVTIAARFNSPEHCQATGRQDQQAKWELGLRGPAYDFTTLELTTLTDTPSQDYFIGDASCHYAKLYHRLQHFKYNLHKHCQREVQYLKASSTKKETSDLLDQCLQNRAWVQLHFRTFKELLETEIHQFT